MTGRVPPLIIDTAGIPIADTHAWWTEQIGRTFGLQSRLIDRDRGFAGRIEITDLPALRFLRFNIRNNLVERARADIRQFEWDSYILYLELGAGALFEIGGQEYATHSGDLIVSDGDVPMQTRARTDFHHEMWMLPKAMLDPHLPTGPRPLTLHLTAQSGLAALLVSYVRALATNISGLPQDQAPEVSDHLGRLVALSCGVAERHHAEAITAAQLARARQHIEQNLGLADLDAEQVAAAIGMDARALQDLFEAQGEGFPALIRRRRLERCRAQLLDPACAHLSITEIAFDSGFASLPTFYRAFGEKFDAAPGEMRKLPRR